MRARAVGGEQSNTRSGSAATRRATRAGLGVDEQRRAARRAVRCPQLLVRRCACSRARPVHNVRMVKCIVAVDEDMRGVRKGGLG